jgi:hypothetical protein
MFSKEALRKGGIGRGKGDGKRRVFDGRGIRRSQRSGDIDGAGEAQVRIDDMLPFATPCDSMGEERSAAILRKADAQRDARCPR